ncbi:GDSL esterase/lipase At1g09390-like [Telopea speciosissima]|uniref:GDSL esterase/lipase At1g09390-like n=1 Tax=Telopea speciosissima TaxID=54955 RepID=UPI001CC41953|nr:GDSL esterase/lipase At1g09390-like [Telopea speciosissima]
MGDGGGAYSRPPLVQLLTFLVSITAAVVVVVASLVPPSLGYECSRKPVIFNFGDSNSDTGGISAALGFTIGLPNGRTFFHQSSGRLSDGRLVIDFLCESLNISYMTPYLESVGPNFTTGANFAISGSSTLPQFVPFSLDIQILQFLRFQSRSLQFTGQGWKDLVDGDGFQNALYMFDIGQNDLAGAFTYLSYDQVIQKIPSFLIEIKAAVWNIYKTGGKNIWIHNTGPLGCLPQKLSTMTGKMAVEVDEYGCLKQLNNAAKQFNEGLSALCTELRTEMKNVTIVYVDIYAIKYDLIANSTKYGFENPLMACCGYGGPPYNFNPNVTCGKTGYNICNEGLRYISWDGIHYTEAANLEVTSKILFGNYSQPQIKFDYFCRA